MVKNLVLLLSLAFGGSLTTFSQDSLVTVFYFKFNQKTPEVQEINQFKDAFSRINKDKIQVIHISVSSDTVGGESGNIAVGERRYEEFKKHFSGEIDFSTVSFKNFGSSLQRKLKTSNDASRFLKISIYYSVNQIETDDNSTTNTSRDDHLNLPYKGDAIDHTQKETTVISGENNFNSTQEEVEEKENFKGKTLVMSLLFVGDKSTYLGNPKNELEKIYEIYANQPDLQLTISGHSCCKDVVRLSKKRAKRVYKDLKAMGIPKQQMSYIGYGNKKPLVLEVDEKSRQKNRRVEIEFR